MGHSMGASGVYYLANQYPDRWAALAAISGGNPGVTNSVEMPPDAGAKIRHIAQNPANLEKVFLFFDIVTRRKAAGR